MSIATLGVDPVQHPAGLVFWQVHRLGLEVEVVTYPADLLSCQSLLLLWWKHQHLSEEPGSLQADQLVARLEVWYRMGSATLVRLVESS